jgi:hypothetical protein
MVHQVLYILKVVLILLMLPQHFLQAGLPLQIMVRLQLLLAQKIVRLQIVLFILMRPRMEVLAPPLVYPQAAQPHTLALVGGLQLVVVREGQLMVVNILQPQVKQFTLSGLLLLERIVRLHFLPLLKQVILS